MIQKAPGKKKKHTEQVKIQLEMKLINKGFHKVSFHKTEHL
jgi:hypothetical protein